LGTAIVATASLIMRRTSSSFSLSDFFATITRILDRLVSMRWRCSFFQTFAQSTAYCTEQCPCASSQPPSAEEIALHASATTGLLPHGAHCGGAACHDMGFH
jgi:hypothetical protein